MKHKFIKLLLSYDFYSKNRSMVTETMFPDFMRLFYDVIVAAHGRYKRTLTIDELEQLVLVNNPMLTMSQKELVRGIVGKVRLEPDIGDDVAQDVLKAVWREEIGRRISQTGLQIIEGKASITDVAKIVEHTSESFLPDDSIKPITTDVKELLAVLDKRAAWQFNIPAMGEHIGGISEGEFAIIFARPEVGKTACVVSTICAPGGFAWQGASVHVLVNEEPAVRTMLRCISAASGLTKEQIKASPEKAAEEFGKIRKNINIIDDVDMTMDRLDAYVRSRRPDILIVDQLDKVYIDGAFARKDEMLGHVYQMAREIGKRRQCAVIGITQASADAEGKTQLHYSMMAESKTSKAAEADLIIGLGMAGNTMEDPTRFITVSKNKLTGFHGTRNCLLNTSISRFVA